MPIQTDIRALQVFDEIFNTRSVTRASEAMGVGQPAVSIALAKLRRHFDDALFVRMGSAMEPTPLALELHAPIRAALTSIELVMGHNSRFDPATSSRTFRVSLTDLSQLLLLPRLSTHLRAVAPSVCIEIVSLSHDTPRMLEAGEIDLALGVMPELGTAFFQQRLFNDRHVCIVSKSHPRIVDHLARSQFESEGHVIVTSFGAGGTSLKRELIAQGFNLRVGMQAPHYLAAAFVVEQSDLLSIVPERLAMLLSGRVNVNVMTGPFELTDFTIRQHWHARYNNDPGHRWFRAVLKKLLN